MEKPWTRFYAKGTPPTLDYPDTPLDTLLRTTARQYPDHVVSNFVLSYILRERVKVGGTLTYHQLNELVDRMVTALYQLGVRKGDRVALMLPNSPQYIIAFFAVMRLGAVAVNVNPTYTSRELQFQLTDSGAETIVLLNLFWPRLREIQTETPLKRVIVAHIADLLPFPSRQLVQISQRRQKDWVTVRPEHNIFFFQHLLDKYAPTPPQVAVAANDVAVLQYTGGTTGVPKAAMLTHRNLMSNVLQIHAWFTDRRMGEEKLMAAIPFFHAYGMTICLLTGIYLGAELVIVPNPRPIENTMKVIHKERCTVFPGVPAMYIAIVNHPHAQKYDLKSVRACVSGSAPLPMEIQEKFGQITGGRLVEGYGLTEASPVTHANPLYGTRRAGSIGIPLVDVEAKLVDLDSGADLPLGTEQRGELCLRGPQVMAGYWQRPDETARTMSDGGWLHTGDICKVDADGFFYIVDRKKDMIIASGFKVVPRDVEEVLFMHPKVLEAVVVGVPHPTRGDDTVKAFVVPQPDSDPTAEEIRAFCRLHLAPYKVPREIEFRDSLPKTAVGKVLRRVLIEEEQARIAAEQSSDASNPASEPAPAAEQPVDVGQGKLAG